MGFILNETKSGDPMVQKVMELDQDLLNIRKMNLWLQWYAWYYVTLLFSLILIMHSQPVILIAPNKMKSNFRITENDPNFEK